MIFIRETAIYIHIEGDAKELSSLIEATKIRPPNYWRADSYQLYKMSGGKKGWDGYMKLIERSAAQAGKALRGLQDSVLEACKTLNIEVDKEKLIKSPFHGLVVDDVPDDLLVSDFELDGNQKACIASWLNHGHGVHKVTVSGGKCLGKGTPVLMFDGHTKNVEDIVVGDLLMGPDSTQRRVLSLAKGQSEMFKVTQGNGDSYECNDDHLLCLQTTGMRRRKRKISVGTERLMTAKEFSSLSKSTRTAYKGFKVGVEFPEKPVPLDPYVMGLWLGDGLSSGPGIVVSDQDIEISEYLKTWSVSQGLRIRFEPGKSCQTYAFSSVEGGWHANILRETLHTLELVNNKHIPDVYRINNRQTRLSLLAGIVDSDGHMAKKKNGTVIVGFSNLRLATQTCWLARSLGFRATLSDKTATIKSTGFSGPTWRIFISGDLRLLPTRVERKKVTTVKVRGGLRCSVDIRSIGHGTYYGFELDGDHRFILGDFTVTHNTAMFCAAAAMIKRRFPESRFLYLTPTERLINQVYRESKKFLPDWDITQFGGGKKNCEGKDMVVATAACMHANYDELTYEKWFRTFMTVLVDESHHSSSESWQRILLSTPAFFRLGASDTTREDDVVAFSRIHGLVGPIRNRVEVDPLIRVGRVAKPTIYVVDNLDWKDRFSRLPHTARPESPAWVLINNKWSKANYVGPVFEKAEPDKKTGDYKESEQDGLKRDRKGELIPTQNMHHVQVDDDDVEIESRWCLLERVNDLGIIQFKERNQLIADWAKHFSDQGHPTLVVATRTLHILILQASISKLVKPELVRILFSTHDSKERDETFEWLKKTPGAVLITPLVKEGVSINEIRGGIVADHVVSHELMSQIIGRFIRQKKTGKNECEIVMFIDRQHPRLKKNGLALLEKLEKIRGYEYVFPVLGPDTKDKGTRYECLF